MPTIFRSGPYRFFFFSSEANEPPHVHVQRDGREAKFWVQPVGLARNRGLPAFELRKMAILVRAHQRRILSAWYGHFRS